MNSARSLYQRRGCSWGFAAISASSTFLHSDAVLVAHGLDDTGELAAPPFQLCQKRPASDGLPTGLLEQFGIGQQDARFLRLAVIVLFIGVASVARIVAAVARNRG